MRLNKYIASHTPFSRRAADELIRHKHIRINKELAELGTEVTDTDVVSYQQDGMWKVIEAKVNTPELIGVYKDIGLVCSHFDPTGDQSIFSILPEELSNYLFIGRLDKNSEGLLLLTNDGDTAHRLMHPSFGTKKVYFVQLDEPLTSQQIDTLSQGIDIEQKHTAPIIIDHISEDEEYEYRYLNMSKSSIWYKITLTDGMKRQIRIALEQVDHKVRRLIRVKHGDYTLTRQMKLNPVVLHI
jgi:23S rRNA pseudouridine2605 synthase